MSVTILRGIPGSGKSTWVAQEFGILPRPVWLFAGMEIHEAQSYTTGASFSADDIHCDKDDVYKFDFKRLAEGHQSCLKHFTRFVQNTDDKVPLVVDNTGTSIAEVAPYAALAGAFGHSLRIVTLICDPTVAFKRNVHGVSFDTIFKLDRRLRDETALLPPYWPHKIEPAA